MKKIGKVLILVVIACFITVGCGKKLEPLPAPELEEGERGEFGIDKNINESSIDQYLNRKDTVYRDMRMLEDPGDYESIGGDSMLSGYIKGFEVFPLPYVMKVSGLPESVGDTYQGRTLFSIDEEGNYIANYEESMSIIEKYFPKDKYIFLMCGGGGYAGMMKQFLVSLGWDANKIYNIGGYWYYKGENNVEVKKVVDGKISYDFSSVPYLKIDFSKLTKANILLETQDVDVEKVNLNPKNLSLVIGEKYKLTETVLPVYATEQRVTWTSSNENIVTVDNGFLLAQKEGTATIIVKTLDGDFIATTKVTVTKEPVTDYITLSDISKEKKELEKLDIEKLWEEYKPNLEDEEEWQKLYEEYEKKAEQYTNQRAKILNSLLDNKKSFIVVLEEPGCYAKPFSPVLSIKKVLDENKIEYFNFDPLADSTFYESKLNEEVYSSIIIVKDGKVHIYADGEDEILKTDADVKKWLGRYVKIK